MINKDGKTVAAMPDAIMAAAAGADWAKAPGFYMILTDSVGPKSWPIAGATFILVPKQPKDTAATKEALDFFAWAYKNGGEMASSLDYIPMPDSVVSMIQAKWKSEIKSDGKPVY
jgi:phosphate transport system substrate-binding protein